MELTFWLFCFACFLCVFFGRGGHGDLGYTTQQVITAYGLSVKRQCRGKIMPPPKKCHPYPNPQNM